jgi:sugar/nucleoside kinase (ribokinase family)
MSHKVKIVAIGAAVQDVFLQGKIFKAQKEGDEYVQEFELGSKNEIENVTFSTGGGATNAAVTFARQGMDSHYMGRIAHDIAGQAVMDALHHEGVDTSLVYYSDLLGTAYSAILLAPNGERTVLTYRGASQHYELHADHFHHTKPDWFYISSLSGDFAALKVIMHYAKQHGIKVAINPGKGELAHSHDFKELLSYVNILSVNKEEMEQLFHAETTEDLMHKATRQVPVVVITDGPKGVIACDGYKIYKAGMYEDVKVVDRLGAGDAFSSGFVAMIGKGESIEQAITFASANSTSVVSKIGAKTGILHAHSHLHTMPIQAEHL